MLIASDPRESSADSAQSVRSVLRAPLGSTTILRSRWVEDERALDPSGAKIGERLVRPRQGPSYDVRDERRARGQREQLVAVATGQVGDGAHRSFAPQQSVG